MATVATEWKNGNGTAAQRNGKTVTAERQRNGGNQALGIVVCCRALNKSNIQIVIKCCTCGGMTAKVTAPDVYAILPPQSGDRQPENVSRWLLDNLLVFMVSEVLN